METYGKMYKASILLERLLKKHGPQEFGRICQLLLGLTLKELNFKVPTCQLSGRPDIEAIKGSKGYSMEVKAPTKFKVTIGNKDLEGVYASGHQPVIAVLSYPDVKTRWIMANAQHLHADKFNKISLEKHSIKSLEKEINKAFGGVLEKYYDEAAKRSRSLKRIFDRV